jgi:hypothetical protein
MLLVQRSAFLFGNTATDVQVVSKQAREDTHFFTLPIQKDVPPPWELILTTHPALAKPARMTGEHAAFMAGYLCHLQADWLWIDELFLPVFGPDANWTTFSQRLYLHNVLRSYLDRQVMAALPPGIAGELELASPRGWLPFVEDKHLREWRDYISGQLAPGAAAQTVEVFAARQGIPVQEFYRLLESEGQMDREIFSHLPRSSLIEYRRRLISMNVSLLNVTYNPVSAITVRSERSKDRNIHWNHKKSHSGRMDLDRQHRPY